jgi:signal transduction histidine kinase/CheY-like chemotaxis protein
MQYFNRDHNPTSVKRKVAAGFLLVFIAILAAMGIARFGFKEMMETVNQLSAPNNELSALNNIFHEITAFDQEQREQAIRSPKKPYKAFLNQSNALVNKIDSLTMMDWDSTQQIRLLEIKQILQKRNRLFFSYLKLKSELVENQNLSQRLDTLSRILVNEKVVVDTSVVTTQRKTTTTLTKDSVTEKDERSGIAKLLFRRKEKPAPTTTHIKVEQELSVIVDTLSIARQNRALEEVEQIIIDLENDQRAENNRLFNEELELIHANSLLINQLLSILHEVENDELTKMRENNDHAASLVTSNITRISILLLVFFIGAAILVYFIWIDITRSNYYKEQLERAKIKAEELSMIKQRFLANMSHEIRTPLQSIIGFAEQLKNESNVNNEAVTAINSSSEHLLHIVDEVLDYSRISSGSFVLNHENFSLINIIKEVESAVRVQAERKGLMLLLDTEQIDEHTLWGDPFRLRQILYNLLGNAIKFTRQGYVKLSVKTASEDTRVKCFFKVTDTGIGMAREELARIFNQFEQANAQIAGQHGGTGLGLSIVKSLVEAQDGTIEVASQPGQGSTFSVHLNYENTKVVASEVTPVNDLPTSGFNGSVIMVDDDDMILRLCSVIMRNNNIRFHPYRKATDLLRAEPDPAVTHILVDIRMPEMSGTELCKLLHKKYSDQTRFVAITAHVFPQDEQELRSVGFDDVIAKPFREQDLLTLFGISTRRNNDPGSTTPDIDLSRLRKMTMGDEALFQSILTQFIEETKQDVELLGKFLEGSKPDSAREIIHKLAGRLGQMGVSTLSSELRELESGLVADNSLSSHQENILVLTNQITALLDRFRTFSAEASSQS